VWHGFRGGKGAGTAVGALLAIQPMALLPLLATWLVTLGLTGWVGLATMLAGLSLIPAMSWLGASPAQHYFAIVLALFLVFTHRKNIRDMLIGEEYRFEKAMIRNWFR
jgi:glycerol-3-phosphate acyltransferase PlsY